MKYNNSEYLSGEKLYGDDFTLPQIKQWFEDEKEGYAELGAKDKSKYVYEFHTINKYNCFRFLPKQKKYKRVLGFGSAYGDEFIPIIDQIDEIIIVEPSDQLVSTHINGKPVRYIKPLPSGDLPFDDDYFDMIICFSVLHHIPNVSHIVSEFKRCTAKDGFILIREPIISMGDWTQTRTGLTKHERGIPYQIFMDMFNRNQLKIIQARPCFFFQFEKLVKKVYRKPFYNSSFLVWCDYVLSYLFSWNVYYHATNKFQKIRPIAIFFTLQNQTS